MGTCIYMVLIFMGSALVFWTSGAVGTRLIIADPAQQSKMSYRFISHLPYWYTFFIDAYYLMVCMVNNHPSPTAQSSEKGWLL